MSWSSSRAGEVWRLSDNAEFLVLVTSPNCGCELCLYSHHHILPLGDEEITGHNIIFERSFQEWRMERLA